MATDTETAAAISSHNTAANGHTTRGNTAGRPASPTVGDVYINTENGVLEIYESTGWASVVSPSVPSSVVATNQGSGRAYNSGQASVAFSAGTFAGTTYTITSSPGSYTASGSTSPITITGLQSSTQYTYTAVASSKFGISAVSSSSTGVTATTVPQAPTIDSVTAGDTEVSVAFTAGATGGSAITGYTVTSSPGNITGSGSSSPITVTGLTNDTAYTFTITATNANGTSTASSASSSVTPVVPTITVDALIIGGGGSAVNRHGGGGGAGGYIARPSLTLLGGTSYTITVGAGAPQNSFDSGNMSNGANSVLSGGSITLTALGGGSGGNNPGGWGGNDGGSGGGGAATYGARKGLGIQSSQSGDSGTYGFGNNGGNAISDAGGGGGGAGDVGGNAGSSTSTGSGGSGKTWLNGTTYAGGGCGAGRSNHSIGSGGSGGGGGFGTAGTANTGGGGGGGNDTSAVGGAGGSGVVILRASGSVTAASTTGSPTRTESGGYTYYAFTGSGSITY